MRNAVAVLAAIWASGFTGAARAQVNYELFPGYGETANYPPIVNYRAWVISYRDNRYYSCIASYEYYSPATPKLTCDLRGTFNPPLLAGTNVKTLQTLGGPHGGAGVEEPQSGFFWQIDQSSGQIQFCIPAVQVNCVRFQIAGPTN
jgi:hypothetical protein